MSESPAVRAATDALLAASPEIRALHLLNLAAVVESQLAAVAADPDVREAVARALAAALSHVIFYPNEAEQVADAVLAALGGRP